MKRLQENILNNQENYLLPFLWIHGEGESILRHEIENIYANGIRALCVEARPHSDFNGDGWFRDLEVILTECKQLGMQMWLLDDSHFPTGFANGEVKKNHPELCKKYLCLKTMDYVGPLPGSGACLNHVLLEEQDEILGVYLQESSGFEEIDPDTTIDVTYTLHETEDYFTGKPKRDRAGRQLPGIQETVPVVDFNLPEGHWYLNVLTVSYKGGEKNTEGYLNPIVPEATDVLLNTVYKPVYDHFGEEFGKTFMGFFSDEPRFGNLHGAEDASIGRNSAMNLPWRDDMPALLASHCRDTGGLLANMSEERLKPLLPLLFIGSSELAHALRFAYMDLVSALYSEHFDGRIAKWCHAHGCQHIGHCIEDNGASARLGYGTGHLFRAMAHADMAGIDVVMHQLLPGQNRGMFKAFHQPGWDGGFYTWLLGKFGGSLAHLDPKKRGRCMCEIFGAYGWGEGTRLEKWLVDHMLVRGVNVLVPHAFDCADFPDADCPPHFGAKGNDAQLPEFRLLMEYSNRMCHLLSGGVACPDVALYFNAEGEWSGDYMPTEQVAAVLARGTIDFDLVSADFLSIAGANCGRMEINNMKFSGLVIPWAEALPGQMLKNVIRLAESGVPVWFVQGLPKRCSEGGELPAGIHSLPCVHIVGLSDLAMILRKNGLVELCPSEPQPDLRAYHYRQPDGEIYFFTNEGPSRYISTLVTGAEKGKTYEYDPFTNKVWEDDKSFNLELPPYGSKVILVTNHKLEGALPERQEFHASETIVLENCQVLAAYIGNKEFNPIMMMGMPDYLSRQIGYESFSGRIRYVFNVELTAEQCRSRAQLVLEGVREGAKVCVNGTDCGTRICGDYHFEVNGLQEGRNRIEVELNTTLVRSMHDFLSMYLPLEPCGMTGAVLKLQQGIKN